MKKFLASILALCLLCSSGIFGIRAFAVTEKTEKVDDSVIHDDSRTDSNNYTDDVFAIAPYTILNQETNCYDIDIYVESSNKYFSNFEAEIYIDGENSKTPKLSIEQYATGNFTAGITKNMDTGTTLNIVFNAPKNVDMSAGYVVNFNDENLFIFKLATIKTDIKQNVIEEGSELDSSTTVIRMGFYAEGGEVKTAGFINGNKVISFAETYVAETSRQPVLPGDYDFDGVLTVKDLITAQYYLTNHVYPESYFLMDMLTSTGLQYLQMYLCETISFSDYLISLYENAGMIAEKWYECDTYWDYDYWGDEDFPTDEQGYKYLGEDRYGNYHV